MRELVFDRRKVLAAVAGAGVAATVATRLPGRSRRENLVPIDGTRAAGKGTSGGRTAFASQDDSYARAAATLRSAKAPPTSAVQFASAGEAAAHTRPTVPTILATDDPIAHLLRRATWAPTPALATLVRAQGIDAWLEAQLAPETLSDGPADAAWAAFPMASADPATVRATIVPGSWDAMTYFGEATMARQIWSQRQLFEIMVDVWANHLNVPVPGPGGNWDVGPAYHRDVIRAHALGSFSDMLVAAARHPAMLRYLNGEESTRQAVNENYGRELLELHTVSVTAGYSEADVRNSAYILTGRTVAADRVPGPPGTFVYDPSRHWTGRVKVMDFEHDNASAAGGMAVGDAYLRHLAALPATARTVARKIAVRFVADVPSPDLVDRLAKAYLDNGTQIVPVLRAMFRSGEFWAAVGQKVRRPHENIVASVRALGFQPGADTQRGVDAFYRWTVNMGQRPLGWPSPNGYPDVHAAWRSAGAVVDSWNNHRLMLEDWAQGLVGPDPDRIGTEFPRATVGQYVDSLCLALCLQTFQPAHRNALIAFTGADAGTPAAQAGVAGMAKELIALVLDSPYFSLR